MSHFKGNIINNILAIGFLIVMLGLCACSSKNGSNEIEDDPGVKDSLQGVWGNDLEGNIVFTIKGDSIFFNDSLSTPAPFNVHNDTIIIRYHEEVRYYLKSLTSSSLSFINQEGDEVELTKISDKPQQPLGGNYVPNQGKVIKKDSVMQSNDNHFHAYTQVNPTSYKVYHQTTNSDGLNVQSVYYDNLIHVALYNGSQKVFGQNFGKNDFAKFVPKSYLSQAILSDIVIDSVIKDGVRFIAILSIPDSYTNYRVNIDISLDGKKNLSIN